MPTHLHPHPRRHDRTDLVRIATDAMRARGLEPVFSGPVLRQVEALDGPAGDGGAAVQDLTALPWCSIDNDDSRDLDQLTVAEPLAGGAVRVRVAVADVDALVARDSPVDVHARTNTTSVYTSACVFPMLPERLCTDLTSLNPGQERLALVTEMVVNTDGSLAGATVYRARVRNQAQLAYDAVSAWIDGDAPLPDAAAGVPGLREQLVLQDLVAQTLRVRRHAEGALEFQTFQPRAVFEGERVVALREQAHNRARQLIEEFMIATNGCTARFLAGRGRAALRRVVRSPERWLRIVALAQELGETLPHEPDSAALAAFLARRRRVDPLHFPDLSLTVVKLMGSGEYVVEAPRGEPVGHFGLAVRDYAHSTAPNRRYPDLVTLRLIKAALAGAPAPYSVGELGELARHCTRQEDAAQKVERQMRKSEAALLLEPRVGERFDALVTGVTDDGIWVRTLDPPAEGKLVAGDGGLRVGARLAVKLVATNVEHGFIDFVLLSRGD